MSKKIVEIFEKDYAFNVFQRIPQPFNKKDQSQEVIIQDSEFEICTDKPIDLSQVKLALQRIEEEAESGEEEKDK